MTDLNTMIANFLVKFPAVNPDVRALLQDVSNKPYLPEQQDLDAIADKQRRLDLLQQKMQKPLNRMHRDLVTNIKDYIDNSGLTFDSVAAGLLAENIMQMGNKPGVVLAYEQQALNSFLKILTAFALIDKDRVVTPNLAAKIGTWYSEAQPIITEMKLQKANEKVLLNTKNAAEKKEMERVAMNLKPLRTIINQRFAGKDVQNFFYKENKATHAYLSNLMTYYNSKSDNAYRHIINNVGMLKEPLFNAEIEPEAKVPLTEAINNMKAQTAKHGGKGLMLTDEQEAKLKAKKPEEHKEYRKHVLHLRDGRRAEIKRMVRASGADKLPVATIKSGLTKLGLPTAFIPQGFNGFYDENSDMYAANGKKFAANIDGGTFIPNPTYDPKRHGHQYIGTHDNPRAEKPQKVYTEDHKASSHEHKIEVVKQNTENLPAIRDTWRHDMKTAKAPNVTYAHLLEALYQTSSRIGSRDEGGNTGGDTTYGLRTILVQHVKANSDGSLTIHFPGKSSMHQTYKIKPNDEHKIRLINYIKKKLTNKTNNHPVWTMGTSLTALPKLGELKKYTDGIGWTGGTHKLRHMKGNELALAYMKKHPAAKKLTKKAAEDYMKELGTTVGKQLGHQKTRSDGTTEPTHLTALKSYIDPEISKEFYQSRQLALPNWLEQALKGKK